MISRMRIELSQLKPGDLFIRVNNIGADRHIAVALESVLRGAALAGANIPEELLWCLTTWNLKQQRANYLRYWLEQGTAYYLLQEPDGA